MHNLKKTFLMTVIISASICVSGISFADTQVSPTFKVAVVNVPAVIESSSEVMALKKEQQLKMEEIQKWLTTAKADVDKQSTKEGKEKLIKKYDEEFAKKQAAIRNDYSKKIEAIDKNITTVIEQERKAKGYDLVLAKGTVLSGGIDITKEIAKKVK